MCRRRVEGSDRVGVECGLISEHTPMVARRGLPQSVGTCGFHCSSVFAHLLPFWRERSEGTTAQTTV